MVTKITEPLEGVYKQNDWGGSIVYGVVCQCGDDNCKHNVWVEADAAGVFVTTYTKQKTNWWSKNRWQIIWQLLTTGYVKYEASIIMSEQQALDYARTLETAVDAVKQFHVKHK
jgi:hypothetical protein